jgi:hypothetical protein
VSFQGTEPKHNAELGNGENTIFTEFLHIASRLGCALPTLFDLSNDPIAAHIGYVDTPPCIAGWWPNGVNLDSTTY